jgi:hypothetical protein
VNIVTRGKRWSVEEERALEDLVKTGVSVVEISKTIGRSIVGVRDKISHLGLEDDKTAKFDQSSSLSSSSSSFRNKETIVEECSNKVLPDLGLDDVKPELQSSLPVLVSPKELPTVQEVLMKLAGAMANLEQPGLNRSEAARYKILISAAEKYEKLYVDYAKYKALEGRLVELEGKYFELVKKQKTS